MKRYDLVLCLDPCVLNLNTNFKQMIKSISILYFILTLLVLSCGHPNENEPSTEESHIETYSITSDSYEVIIVNERFIKDKDINSTLYITRLSDGKPLDTAKIKVGLIVGEHDIFQIAEKKSAGIYACTLKPLKIGKGELRISIEINGLIEELKSNDIEVYSNYTESAEHHDEEGVIYLSKPQQWMLGCQFAKVEQKPFSISIKLAAEVKPVSSNEQWVSARTSGIVSISSNLSGGQFVAKGTILGVVEGSGLAENNATMRYNEALNRYNQLKVKFEQQSKLKDSGLVSQAEWMQTQNDFQDAKSRYETLNASFSPIGQTLIAPFNGRLVKMTVKNGQVVESGEPLFLIVNSDEVQLQAWLTSDQRHRLNDGCEANIQLPGKDKWLLGKDINLQFEALSDVMDAEMHRYLVTFNMTNTLSLRLGEFVNIYLFQDNSKTQLVIPNQAILEEQGLFYVMVRIEPFEFEKREIHITGTNGIESAIESGLTENEQVVTESAMLVKLAGESSKLDPHAGHVH